MTDGYAALAKWYDRLMDESADYDGLVDFYDRLIRESGLGGKTVLDLGCGTGEAAIRMAALGYEIVGVDISSEMLAVADFKLLNLDPEVRPLLLCQDIRDLDLFGTVSVAYSSLDVVNSLPSAFDIERVFAKVALFLEPGGIFVFDANTPYRFRNVYAGNTFLLDDSGVFLVWENIWDEGERRCTFELTFFEEEPDGRYSRSYTEIVEYEYEPELLVDIARKCGFTVRGIFGEDRRSSPKSTDQRIYIVCDK